MLLPDDLTSFARAARSVAHSPAQLLSPRNLVHQCRLFREELPQVRPHYAFKSGSSLYVVRAIDPWVSGYDVASPEEIRRVLAEGVDPGRLRYSNPVKAPSAIEEACSLGVTKFAAQSVAELHKIARHAPGAAVYLRLRVGASQGALDFSAKFGAPVDDVLAAAPEARELGLHLTGLTFNAGSQSTDTSAWRGAIAEATAVIRRLRERGIEVAELNIGGGFPVRYAEADPDPRLVLRAVRSELEAVGQELPGLTFLAEPGRFISAPSGALVLTVIGREERAGRTWLYLDAGAFQAFVERFEFRRLLQPVHSVRHVLSGEHEAPTETYALTGPTCDAFDTLTTGVDLPAGLDVGDRLLFTMAGAYTVEYGSHFNGFAPPTVVSLGEPSELPSGAARVPGPRRTAVAAS